MRTHEYLGDRMGIGERRGQESGCGYYQALETEYRIQEEFLLQPRCVFADAKLVSNASGQLFGKRRVYDELGTRQCCPVSHPISGCRGAYHWLLPPLK